MKRQSTNLHKCECISISSNTVMHICFANKRAQSHCIYLIPNICLKQTNAFDKAHSVRQIMLNGRISTPLARAINHKQRSLSFRISFQFTVVKIVSDHKLTSFHLDLTTRCCLYTIFPLAMSSGKTSSEKVIQARHYPLSFRQRSIYAAT